MPWVRILLPLPLRGVAQLGSATGLGPVGRGFKSCHPDHFFSTWAISSVGQSIRLITGRSWVQVPDGPPYKLIDYAQIAQLVEHVTENHSVLGSIPSLGTNILFSEDVFLCLLCESIFTYPYTPVKKASKKFT